jgi:Prolyl oligopeptidase family.
VFGTSAGGHLASMLGTFLSDYARVGDALDGFLPTRFHGFASPVIMLSGDKIHKGSAINLLGDGYSVAKADSFSTQNRVTNLTAKTLLFHADNDTAVPSENSVAFYQACRQAGVPASLHIFDKGGHKIALTHNPITTDHWKSLMAQLVDVECDSM